MNRRNILNIVNSILYRVIETKRTLGEEKRIFNSQWELDYFMIETPAHTMMCLICNQVVKTLKGVKQSNIFVVIRHTLT